MIFCNLDINFSRHSERKMIIEVFNKEDLSLLIKFSILIDGNTNISVEELSEYCSIFESKNKGKIGSIDLLYTSRSIFSFSLDGVRVPFMHFDVSMYDGRGILLKNTKAHMMSLRSVCGIISCEISDFCMYHMGKLKSLKSLHSPKSFSLRSWATSKIEKIIMNGLYDFCNHMYLRQNFRTIDCLKRISSLCYSSKKITSWDTNFLTPVFCGLYCEDVLNKDFYRHMTTNNCYVYLSLLFKWNGSNFCLRDSHESCPSNLFLNYRSAFYKKIYENMPHSCGCIAGNFISSLDSGKYISSFFDDIDFCGKKKFFKMFWMIVFCLMAPYSIPGNSHPDESNDRSHIDLINFAKKEWSNEYGLKEQLKDFSVRNPCIKTSKLRWLSVYNMYAMVNRKYIEIIKNRPKKVLLGVSLKKFSLNMPY